MSQPITKELSHFAARTQLNLEPDSFQIIFAALRRKHIQVMGEGKFLSWSDLPEEFQSNGPVEINKQYHAFERYINFAITALSEASRSSEVSNSDGLTTIREAMISVIDYYESVVSQLRLPMQADLALLIQEFLHIYKTLYRLVADQVVKLAIHEHTSFSRKTDKNMYRAARRSSVIYEKIRALPDLTFNQTLQHLSIEQATTLQRLKQAGYTFPESVDMSEFAMVRAWFRAATLIFLYKTKNSVRLDIGESNPELMLFNLVEELFPSPELSLQFVDPPQHSLGRTHYKRVPEMQSPLDKQRVKRTDFNDLRMSDLFSLVNATYHLYAVTMERDAQQLFTTDQEYGTNRKWPLAEFLNNLIQVLVFLDYTLLAEEFSTTRMANLAVDIRCATEMSRLTGRDMRHVIQLRVTLGRIISMLKSETTDKGRAFVELFEDPRDVETEGVRYRETIRVIKEISDLYKQL